MSLFLSTTFEWKGSETETLRPYMALIAASVRIQEVILVFFGHDGEDRIMLICDPDGVCGAGHAFAPPSIFQNPERPRRQPLLYMDCSGYL